MKRPFTEEGRAGGLYQRGQGHQGRAARAQTQAQGQNQDDQTGSQGENPRVEIFARPGAGGQRPGESLAAAPPDQPA